VTAAERNRGSANSEFRSGTNPLDFTVRSGQTVVAAKKRARAWQSPQRDRTSANAESRTMARGGAEIPVAQTPNLETKQIP